MNKSSFLGFLFVSGVLYLGAFHSAKNPGIFFEPHAILFVFGGTIAAAFVAYPWSALSRTVDYFLWGLLFKKKKNYLKLSQDIAGARNSFLINQNYLTNEESHPFFREAVMFLLNKNIDDAAFKEIMKNRSDYFHKKYNEDAKILRSLAKYPIWFGLLGSVVGLVESMQNLGNPNSIGIGPAIAVALVPTFLGITFANFIITPLADSAEASSEEDRALRNLIKDGMILIRSNATDDHFQAFLRGYLSLSDRGELKVFTNQNVQSLAKSGITLKRKKRNDSDLDENQEEYINPSPMQALQQEIAVNPPVMVKAIEAEIATQIASNAPTVVGTDEVNQETVAVAPSSSSPPPSHLVSDTIAHKITEVAAEPTMLKTKTEISGRVEVPVKISLENEPVADPNQFKFKDLRKELKKRTAR